jgi:hypothetical protein
MWSPRVTVVTKRSLDPAGADRLGVLGVEVVRDEIRGLIHDDKQLVGVSTESARIGNPDSQETCLIIHGITWNADVQP